MTTKSAAQRTGLALAQIFLGLFGLGVSAYFAISEFASLTQTSPALPAEVPWGAYGIAVSAIPLTTGFVSLARAPQGKTARGMGALFTLTGLIGLWAAYRLSVDKVITLTDPNPVLDCNFSVLVQCGANLQSWQGSLFGFPNPLMGLAGWVAVIVIGIALARGIRLQAWMWRTIALGVSGALAFVIWLISQSIFELGTLCPWCMVTWAVTIPLFWATLSYTAREGWLGSGATRAGALAHAWVPLLTVISYLTVAVIAQLQLDVMSNL